MPDQATTTDATATNANETDTTDASSTAGADTDTTDFKAESRKHEQRAKNLQKELDALRKSTMTDTEKAIAEAEERGRTAARTENAQALAAAEIRAALTGIVEDPAEIVDDLNLAKYITDTGGVDRDGIAALKAKFAKLAPQGQQQRTPGRADLGARSTTGNHMPLNGDPIENALKGALGIR
jgi:hypothetical protein